MSTDVAIGTKLTESERLAYNDANDQIRKHVDGFTVVAAHLVRVRERKLYREDFATFEEYCRGMWGWTSARARQLIGSAEAALQIESVTGVTVSEHVARELAPVPDEQRAAALAEAQKAAAEAGREQPSREDARNARKSHTPITERVRRSRKHKAEKEPEHESADEMAEKIVERAEAARIEAERVAQAATEKRKSFDPTIGGGSTEAPRPDDSENVPTEADGGVVTPPMEASNCGPNDVGVTSAAKPEEPRASSAEGADVVVIRAIILPASPANVEGMSESDLAHVREVQAWCARVIAAYRRASLKAS